MTAGDPEVRCKSASLGPKRLYALLLRCRSPNAGPEGVRPRLAEEIERSTASAGTAGRRAVHWRRGHWRRQTTDSLHKLVCLTPTLVNPGDREEQPLGHLYLVS